MTNKQIVKEINKLFPSSDPNNPVCLGASSYIDTTRSKEDAREYWKKKVAEGWRKCSNSLAPKRDWWFWN